MNINAATRALSENRLIGYLTGRSTAQNKHLARIQPLLGLGVRSSALLAVYLILESAVKAASYLPQASYSQPFIIVELVKRMLSHPLPGLIVALFIFWRYRSLSLKWSALEYGEGLRHFVTLLAFILAWTFATYDYNLYFAQGHYLDRVLLVLLAVLVYLRPIFAFAFIPFLLAVVRQFDYPMAQYPWTETNLLIRAMTLFAASLLVNLVLDSRRTTTYVFLLLCLVASQYWGSGIGKYQLDWISHRHLNLLPLGAYANGWLSFLEPKSIVLMVKALEWLNWPLMLFTLVVEWGALLFLARRRTMIFFLLAFIVFHTGIFATTGMFFWKWIALEIGLLFFFLIYKQAQSIPLFTLRHFLVSLLLIGGAPYWFKPTNLSWYDTPLTYNYRLEGIGLSGARYNLPTHTFTPYGDMFTLGNFHYLNQGPQLTHIWGVTGNRAIADRLLGLRTADDIFAYESQLNRIPFHEQKSLLFDDFIVRFVHRLNQRRSKATFFSILQPPDHLWSFPRDPVFTGQEPLSTVRVHQLTFLYNGEEIMEIRRRVVREIHIPQGLASGPAPSGRQLSHRPQMGDGQS